MDTFVPVSDTDDAVGISGSEPELSETARTTRQHNQVRVSVAGSIDELMAAYIVRAAVWFRIPGAKYTEQFDRNDMVSSHIILWVGDEPVGTVRIRWFAGFAKLERLTIREEYRSLALIRRLFKAAIDHCQAKGYTTILGNAHPAGKSRITDASQADGSGVAVYQRLGAKIVRDPVFYHSMWLYPMRVDAPHQPHEALACGPEGAGTMAFERALERPEEELVLL